MESIRFLPDNVQGSLSSMAGPTAKEPADLNLCDKFAARKWVKHMPTAIAKDQAAERRFLLLDANLQIVFGITIMAIVGVFTIAPALPRIVSDLQITQAQVGWLITIFALPGIFLMPLMGICADLFGRKNVVGLALLLFGVAGGACFFVRDFPLLMVLRFFQGIGAAPLSSLNIAFISDMYTGNRRITAMGYNQAVLSAGAAVFTALGGALATLGWFYPFLLPLLGIPIGLLVLFRLKSPKAEQPPAFSVYFSTVVRTVKQRELLGFYLMTILGLMMVWGSYISYFPILMGTKLQQQPVVIGLVMTSMTICSAFAAAQMGRLSQRFSSRRLLTLSFVLYCAALLMIPFITQRWLFLIPISTFGAAQGIFIPNLQFFLGNLSSVENRGIVMALYGSCIRIGQTLGPFVMGLIFPLVGIDGVFFACAGIALGLVVLVNIMVEKKPKPGISKAHPA